MLIQNQAILNYFDISKTHEGFKFVLKSTEKEFKISNGRASSTAFLNLLAANYFPCSVLVVTEYLADSYSDVDSLILKHFRYRGLSLGGNFSSYLKFDEKPNLRFGEEFYHLKYQLYGGNFNRRYLDILVDKVLPLMKDEQKSFDTFFQLFNPDFTLKGRFVVAGDYISTQPTSLFSDTKTAEIDLTLENLHGKLLVGESGVEIIDRDCFSQFVVDSSMRQFDMSRYTKVVPLDKLTVGAILPYNEDINFQDNFYEGLVA